MTMDRDLNNYDVEHVCTSHPKMSRQAWEEIYREAWALYYTPKHMELLLRRAAATGVPIVSLIKILVNFATTVRLENVHPLQGGILRLKHPSERRPGFPRESVWIFWPRFAWEILYKHAVIVGVIARLFLLKLTIEADPGARSYMDQALTPVGDDDDETLDLLTKTDGGRAAVAHSRKVARLTSIGRSTRV
jgi:hypothetical protein